VSAFWSLIAISYVAGVAWGLFVIDGRTAVRMGLALLWPVGPAAFVLTVGMLLVASVIAFPAFGIAMAAAAALLWLLF
jgi:hypothetical protein